MGGGAGEEKREIEAYKEINARMLLKGDERKEEKIRGKKSDERKYRDTWKDMKRRSKEKKRKSTPKKK